MRISEHFTLEELIESATAKRLHIDNTPSDTVVLALTTLVNGLLEPLRKRYGKAIRVNSGYRSPELNKAVNGSLTSQHLRGEAADIRGASPKENMLLYHLIRTLFNFDQVIAEEYDVNTGTCGWVHVSFKASGNRKNALIKYKGKKGYFYWK